MSRELLELVTKPVGDVVPVAKAYFIGDEGGVQSTVLAEQEKTVEVFGKAGALEPAYDPNVLSVIYENSSALRQNVDSYITNVDGFGHAFVPTLETTAEDAREKIRDALRVERARQKRDPRNATDSAVLATADEPTDEEVDERLKSLETEIRTERARLHVFFDNCTADMPFSGPEGLRGLTRQDIEVMGNGYWEVLRNGLGEVCQFNHIPGISVRLMPIDKDVTEVEIERRVSLLSTEKVRVRKRFRRYVQVAGDTRAGLESNIVVYFKEFGDPRTISSKTGRVYKSLEDMVKEDDEKDALPATEVIAFKITSTRSAYGVPRWIGTLLSVMGTRQAEEVNFLYFENRSVPPMAILVSGGRLNDSTVGRLQDYIQNEIRGKRNFHKIMILEAESSGDSSGQQTGRMKIEIRPLTDSQQKDGLFQNYDERNADKVGQAFRLPRVLRGDVRDFNRSTAEASIDFAEIQVFGPIRQQFDWIMNKLIFPALGVKYHAFRSNAPTVRDPEALAKMIALLVSTSILTPFEARDLAQDVFNRAFENIGDDWTKQPLAITLAKLNVEGKQAENGLDAFEEAGGMSSGAAGAAQQQTGVQQKPKTTPPDRSKPKPKSKDELRAQAKAIQVLRKGLLDASMGDVEDMATEVIKVPEEEFRSWFKTPGV
jgi:PBSX family phage portal protein